MRIDHRTSVALENQCQHGRRQSDLRKFVEIDRFHRYALPAHLRQRRAVPDIGEHVPLVQTEYARGVLLAAREYDRLAAFEISWVRRVSADDDRVVRNRRRKAS